MKTWGVRISFRTVRTIFSRDRIAHWGTLTDVIKYDNFLLLLSSLSHVKRDTYVACRAATCRKCRNTISLYDIYLYDIFISINSIIFNRRVTNCRNRRTITSHKWSIWHYRSRIDITIVDTRGTAVTAIVALADTIGQLNTTNGSALFFFHRRLIRTYMDLNADLRRRRRHKYWRKSIQFSRLHAPISRGVPFIKAHKSI